MDFPNPFKRFRSKKIEISETIQPDQKPEKSKAEKGKPESKGKRSFNPFTKGRRRRAEVEALVQKLVDLEKTEDAAARALRLKEVRDECLAMLAQLKEKGVAGIAGTGAAGTTMIVVGVFTVNPALLFGGIAATSASAGMAAGNKKPKKWTVSPALSKDWKTLAETAERADKTLQETLLNEKLASFERSPRCDEAKFAFPALKARFDAAAEKAQPAERHVPPPANDGSDIRP